MRVLIACEYSGTVREAFAARGHRVTSCDILPTDTPCSPGARHIQGDVLPLLSESWDLVIGHPPCTYLTAAGNRWFYHPDDKHLPTGERRPHPAYPNRRKDAEKAAQFFLTIYHSGDRCCVENPVGTMTSRFRKADQTIQPWQFGHRASKATCLWLRGLPALTPTEIVEKDEVIVFPSGKRMRKWAYDMSCLPHKQRAKARSKTFQGIADAMASQWG